MSRWIDANGDNVGDVGFLVEVCPQGRADSWSLSPRPLHTNGSHEPRLHGWCGETDNVSQYARGVAIITKLNARGDRALVRKLEGSELIEALEQLGWPELGGGA